VLAVGQDAQRRQRLFGKGIRHDHTHDCQATLTAADWAMARTQPRPPPLLRDAAGGPECSASCSARTGLLGARHAWTVVRTMPVPERIDRRLLEHSDRSNDSDRESTAGLCQISGRVRGSIETAS
jgi:hypothetical protein